MKKVFIFKLIGIIFIMSVVVSFSYRKSTISTKATTDIITAEQTKAITEINTKDYFNSYLSMSNSNIQDWQKGYIQFLHGYVILEDYEICEYALRDMNSDGVPELILLQTDMSAKALLEIYSFKNAVFKTGEYGDIKVGSALRVSDNLQYPGLFDVQWGGGIERYGYITVWEDLLVYECLWFDNLAPEEVAKENGKLGKNMVSDNKELIELSESLFLDGNDNNILEMFKLGTDDYQSIINYSAIPTS